MDRRQFLIATGVAGLGSVAGCLGDGDDGEYETLSVDGQSVPLAPTRDVYEWFEEGDLEVVDTRSESEYEYARIAGAVFSPAPDGLSPDDPTEEWATDTRIVTYCVCPHTLASQRAAALLNAGYTDVYALDEGLEEWIEQGHPVEGEILDDLERQRLPTYEIQGESDPAYAGEEVWVREPTSGQREVGTVQEDGGYEVTLHFVDLTTDTTLELETPDYAVTASLEELTSTVVTRPDD